MGFNSRFKGLKPSATCVQDITVAAGDMYLHVKYLEDSFCWIRDSVATCLMGEPANYESRQEKNE